jgi:hypothetical protein
MARGERSDEVWSGLDLLAPAAAPAWLARAPGRLGAFARRRSDGEGRGAPLRLAVEGALALWARGATDRRYRAELARRVAIDAWSAREIRRRRPAVVVAPSLAARRSFAAAREIGARTVLVLDLPLLRALHRDLDRAAEVWPERRFLRRYRAPAWAIAAQEAERVLADEIRVRGAYARATCIADGIAPARLVEQPLPPPPALARATAPTGRVRLAGLAAARHGVDTALAATRALGLVLVVRAGEGTEPADLLARPGVVADDGSPVDAVVCPAVCETYAPEVRGAAIAGLPVVASPGASVDGAGPDPFDDDAVAAALAAALAR